MAVNIIANQPNILVAKINFQFSTIFNSSNMWRIFQIDDFLMSWEPDRAINQVTGATAGKGYYMVPKVNMDVTTQFFPPFDVQYINKLLTYPSEAAMIADIANHSVGDMAFVDTTEGSEKGFYILEAGGGSPFWGWVMPDPAVVVQNLRGSYIAGLSDGLLFDANMPIPGAGLVKNNSNKYQLDYEFTTLINPVITPAWTLFKNDGTTPYEPPTSTSKALTVDKGVKANLSAVWRYPTPGTGQAGPTGVTGAWSVLPSGPNVDSAPYTENSIAADKSISVTISKPRNGLPVVNGYVVPGAVSGNETKADSVSISFKDRSYLIYSDNPALSAADIKAVLTNPASNPAFIDGKGRSFTGVNAGTDKYIYYVYPAAYGDITSALVGAVNEIGAWGKLADQSIANPAELATSMRIWRTNLAGAYVNKTIIFS